MALADDGGDRVKSVERCLRVLKTFTPEQPEFGVAELARRHRVHVSSMSRLLSTMCAEGFVRQVPPGGRYRLGFAIVELGTFAREALDVRGLAAATIWELAEQTGTAVTFAIPSDAEAVVLDRAPSASGAFAYSSWVGRRLPLHASAVGKALLAFAAPREQETLLAAMARPDGTFARYTPTTITTVAELKEDLAISRSRGYAVTRAEFNVDGCAVAAPVFDHEGVARAAIAAPELVHRFDAPREAELVELVVAAAAKISAQLGGRGPRLVAVSA